MANLYVYLLPAILHAVYACVPLTPPRPRPTPKPPGATGEVPATTTTTETTTTTVEACSGTPDNSTVTEDGNRCVFPFKDGDILHTGCVDYKGKYDWCATSLKSDCSFDTWSKCLETTSKPEEKCLTEEVNSGKECLFPFMFEGKEHLECLPYKGKFWCGLTYEYDKQRWGYCTQALCPPTKVEATEVPVTTQGPTEVPVTSQEPETTTTTTTTTTTEVTTPLDWEDAQTTVDIAVDGSFYSCNIDFKMTTDQGVKYKDVTSSCSGSSKTDDMIDKLGVHRFTLTMQSGIGISCQVGAAIMPQSLTLSVEVMENTLKCEPLDSQCITIGGNNFPDNCVFPYNYQGRHYKACTDSSKDPSKLWCPTVVTASGEAEKDSWGFCSPSCGYCAGSPIARGASDSQPCGFDCVLNPAKKKAGLDKATMSLNSPILDKAGVVGGQYTFNFGSQTITISCPEKFHYRALKGEKTVIASCGPEQHRYTVKNKDGDILGTEIKKDSFGCDPCPSSYSYLPGFKASKVFTYDGDVASAKDCKAICEDSYDCQTFEYSKQRSSCKIIKELEPSFSTNNGEDIICKKDENSDPCGTNTALDPSHLLAETNWPYLSQFLNHTGHPNKVYRTRVFQVVSGIGTVVMLPTDCPVDEPGLVSLFFAPVTTQCNEKTLGDSSGEDLHHVMIDTSCDLDATINKFIAEKDTFKTAYHLCAARTRQEKQVAVSRKKTLLDIFSFLYNTQATADSFDPDKARVCKTKEATVKTIQTMFDTAENVEFKSDNKSATEEQGFIEANLQRTPTEKLGVTFVETIYGTANINDIIPYFGLVTFSASSNSASLFTTIIQDYKNEPEEFFEIVLIVDKKRMDNGGTGAASGGRGWETTKVFIKQAASPLTRYIDATSNGNHHAIFTHMKGYAETCRRQYYTTAGQHWTGKFVGPNDQMAYFIWAPKDDLNPLAYQANTVDNTVPNCLNHAVVIYPTAANGNTFNIHTETQLFTKMENIIATVPSMPRDFYLYTTQSPCTADISWFVSPSCQTQSTRFSTKQRLGGGMLHVGFFKWLGVDTPHPTPLEVQNDWCTELEKKRAATTWTTLSRHITFSMFNPPTPNVPQIPVTC